MARSGRLYRIKITRDGKEVFDGFYDGRGLGRMKADAARIVGENDAALVVSHTTMTHKPMEFYKQLRDAEAKSRVKFARVKGIGHRWWTVERSEE